ncbi:MAG: CinA family nicotinamide mononucleotide deamidase-related protein [Candidatus Hydrogenedentes bacterium]|nr:CinA family nicotinamide mononucleotide deamidase-related protein [Candidatus Hydrogenedentota bacterium]
MNISAEIITIGTELLLGSTIDTNSIYLVEKLSEIGIDVYRKASVGDNQKRIVQIILESITRCDVVICTGGLGPTVDDLTRESVAEATNSPLIFYPEVYEKIFERFQQRKIKISENNKKQATFPEGSIIIPNPIGTAPGFIKEYESKFIICLPGVPFELKPMVENTVIPFLSSKFPSSNKLYIKFLKVYGLGESRIDHHLGELLYSSDPTLGLLASPECVKIRIATKSDSPSVAKQKLDDMEAKIKQRLPNIVLPGDDYSLEKEIDKLLLQIDRKLIIVDCSTGGMITFRLTQANSASFLIGSVISTQIFHDNPQIWIDIAKKHMLQFPFAYVIVLHPDIENKETVARILTIDSEEAYKIPFLGTEEKDRIRISVFAIELFRRRLQNITVNL